MPRHGPPGRDLPVCAICSWITSEGCFFRESDLLQESQYRVQYFVHCIVGIMVRCIAQQLRPGYNALSYEDFTCYSPLILSRFPSQSLSISRVLVELSLYTIRIKDNPSSMSSLADHIATETRNMSAETSLQTVYGSTHEPEGRGVSFKERRSNNFFQERISCQIVWDTYVSTRDN